MRDEEQLSLVEVELQVMSSEMSAKQADIFLLTCVAEGGKQEKLSIISVTVIRKAM